MTTPREDAIAAACKECGGDHWTRDHWAHTTDKPREDAPWLPWFWTADTEDDDNWLAEFSGEDIRALVRERNRLLAALAAEAEPDRQRRWHRCEYPGCGLWHDSRDEVTP